MKPSFDDHKFNDDLLLQASDRKLAERKYPSIFHVLDHPELRQLFCDYEAPADRAKRTGLKAGLGAIAFGFGALAVATSELLITHPASNPPAATTEDWLSVALAVTSGICGLLSFLIGSVGVLFAGRKRHWLYCRLMAERIRQFHFQTLVFRLPQILASLKDDAARSVFLSERALWLETFKARLVGKLDFAFASTIREEEEIDPWLHDRSAKEPLSMQESEDLDPIFEAYRELRILHQLDFANYKLHDDHRLISAMPRRQLTVLSQAIFTFIILLVIMDSGVLAGALFPNSIFAVFRSTITIVVIIWLALAALATRAVEQGLQPEREIERYQQYRSGIRAILERYDEASSQKTKIAIMREMERLAFDEMRNFLVTNERSRFVM